MSFWMGMSSSSARVPIGSLSSLAWRASTGAMSASSISRALVM